MKYILTDRKNGDDFDREFATKEEAIKAGEIAWNYLTESEKKKREAFFVLESVNPDEDSEYHFDGDIVKEWK